MTKKTLLTLSSYINLFLLAYMAYATYTTNATLNAGGKVYTIELECDNFKITTPRDLLLAEFILKERKSV